MINLVNDTIDNTDIDNLIEWLKTYPRLTKGPKTREFERCWADYIGSEDSVFVNSGSSAILVMLQTLIETNRIKKGDKVIVPALSWATDLSPVIQLGLTPVLCDCNLEDLSIDIEHFENLCQKNNISTLLLVSVLGLVPNMEKIVDICEKHDVILLEDTCESFGSTFNKKKLGTFGLMSTFSTYFGHHLSTIEGGLLCTNATDLGDDARCIRNHGWDRDYPDSKKEELRKKHNVSLFDSLYTFYMHGFNVRSTDLQAFIGIDQLNKADSVNALRENNFKLYQKELHNDYWKPTYRKNTFCSSFAYPILHPRRDDIVKALNKNNIECRPMICRSMGVQPFYTKMFGKKLLKNAGIVDKFGMYVPNHPQLKPEEINFVCEIINKIIKG